MKKQWLTLFLVSAIALLPSLVCSEDLALTTSTLSTSPSYSADIKAYGDQTATHSLGYTDLTANVTSQTDTTSFTGTIDFMKSGSCTGPGCSFSVAQGDFDYSTTTSTADVTQVTKSVVGTADMSSFGGLAVCATTNFPGYGEFVQVQSIDQTISGPIFDTGLSGTSTYSGSQSLKITTGTP
jgi:hypothetical protein